MKIAYPIMYEKFIAFQTFVVANMHLCIRCEKVDGKIVSYRGMANGREFFTSKHEPIIRGELLTSRYSAANQNIDFGVIVFEIECYTESYHVPWFEVGQIECNGG